MISLMMISPRKTTTAAAGASLAAAAGLAVLLAAAPPLRAETPVIAPELIRAAVLGAHPELAGLRPLFEAHAHSTNPVLIAGPVEHWGTSELRVRVSCREPGDCLPFYVAATRAGEAAGQQPAPTASAAAPTPLHAGTPVMMLVDQGHLHLRVPVTLLGTAPVGGQVRVQPRPSPLSPGSHPQPPVLLATVVDGTTVRGTLPE